MTSAGLQTLSRPCHLGLTITNQSPRLNPRTLALSLGNMTFESTKMWKEFLLRLRCGSALPYARWSREYEPV